MVDAAEAGVGTGTRSVAAGGDPATWARRAGVWMVYATALTPLVFSSRTIYPYVVPRAVFFRVLVAAAAAVAVYLLATRWRSLPGLKREPFLYALAGFVAVLLVTALLGEAPIRSLFGDLERMGGVFAWIHFLAFYVALRTLLTERKLTIFLWVTLGVASVVSAIAVLQTMGVTVGILPGPQEMPGQVRGRAIGTLGNAGYLAIYAMLGMAVAGLLGLRTSHPAGRGLAAAFLAINGAAMLLTWTRAALLGVGAGVLVGLGAYAVMTRSSRKRVLALAAAAGLLLAAAFGGARVWDRATDGAVASEEGEEVSERVADVSLVEQSLGNRIAAWQAGLEAVGDRPLTGLGAENFRLAFDWHLDPERLGVTVHYTRAHNDLVEFLIAGGIPGALAWLLLWIAVFYSLIAARREGWIEPGGGALLVGAFVAYLVYLLFWFHDQNSLPLVLALAGFVALRRQGPVHAAADTEGGTPVVAKLGLALLLALLLAGDALYHGRLLATGHHLLEGARGADLQTRVDHYRRATELRPPGAEEVVTELARFAVRLPGAVRAAGGEPGSSPGVDTVLARARGFVAAQIDRDPGNPRLHRDAGRLHTISYQWNRNPAQLDSAEASLRKAITFAPARLRYRHMLSELYLMADRPDAALRVLDEGLRSYDAYGATYYYRAKALLVAGSPVDAAEALTRAYQLGFRDRNPAVRQLLVRELRQRGEEEVAQGMLEARRARRRGS